jgi:hypothetical protein
MRDIAFATRLTESDWDETFRGWRCPVLNVPGSIIEDLYVDGNRVDKSKYEVLQEHLIVRWVPEERPDRVTAAIKFTEQLSLGRENRQMETSSCYPSCIGDNRSSFNFLNGNVSVGPSESADRSCFSRRTSRTSSRSNYS